MRQSGVNSEERSGGQARDVRELRAVAHPLRLRLLSLLTGQQLTCAEVAKAMDIAPGSAHYHLKQLHLAGLLDRQEASGGTVNYRHLPGSAGDLPQAARLLVREGILANLSGRWRDMDTSQDTVISDLHLWVDREAFAEAMKEVGRAMDRLHECARSPDDVGVVLASATAVLFYANNTDD